MCSSPDIPPPPPPPQDAKSPDTAALTDKAKKNRQAMPQGGTLLTSPTGVTSTPTGKTTLLGQ